MQERVFFMSEQEEPLRRRVALKVLKPGMDTKSVIARFESKRQALAMMDHPNIAEPGDGQLVLGAIRGRLAGKPARAAFRDGAENGDRGEGRSPHDLGIWAQGKFERPSRSRVYCLMNDVISLACLVGLAGLPLAVLGLRATRPRLMPWWAVFSIVVGLGWVLVIVGAMLQGTKGGGAGHVRALFLGWALVLIWFAPWLLGYAIIQFFRRRHASRSA